MTPEIVMTIGQRALEITMLLAAPLLLAALIIGLLVGVFQAATQINEMTLSFIPKLIGMAGDAGRRRPVDAEDRSSATRGSCSRASRADRMISRRCTMLNLTTGQLEAWLAQYLWPFIRIGACFMAAPVFGAQFVPPRVRLFLAGAMTLIVAPLVPPPEVDAVLARRAASSRFIRSSSASPPASRCS